MLILRGGISRIIWRTSAESRYRSCVLTKSHGRDKGCMEAELEPSLTVSIAQQR